MAAMGMGTRMVSVGLLTFIISSAALSQDAPQTLLPLAPPSSQAGPRAAPAAPQGAVQGEITVEAPPFTMPDPLEQERFLREEAEKWRFANQETYFTASREDQFLRLPEMNTGTTLDQRYLGSLLHPCKLNLAHVIECR